MWLWSANIKPIYGLYYLDTNCMTLSGLDTAYIRTVLPRYVLCDYGRPRNGLYYLDKDCMTLAGLDEA